MKTSSNRFRKSGSLLALLALVSGFVPVTGQARIEDLLEQCILEAQKRGYDISSDRVTNRISNAVTNQNRKALRKFCPQTLKKANTK